jgi:NAD(P)H-dependent FMN reductase
MPYHSSWAMADRKFDIPILLGSVRRGRQSARVARFLLGRMASDPLIDTRIVDLREYDFPNMEEPFRAREDPPWGLAEFADGIALADALVVVAPEYNGGYPGALKNALDYLLPEFRRKPVGIVTVSSGAFGGVSCLAQLRLVLLAMGAVPIPASLPICRVQEVLEGRGGLVDRSYSERTDRFIAELRWWAEAVAHQRSIDASREG